MKCIKMRPNAKILRFIAINALLALIIVSQATAQEQGGFVVDKIIVKVDNYIVLKSEHELAYQSYLAEGNPASQEARCEILNRLIMNKLMVAKAEIDSLR
jgi:peptidyl-prolyl cis-trans isomerase SurA